MAKSNEETPAKSNPSNPNAFTVCLNPKVKKVIDAIPRFLRSAYITECIEQRLKREGAPKYTEADADAVKKAMAVKRAQAILAKYGQ